MNHPPQLPDRKRPPRLQQVFDLQAAPIYFVTFNTRNRACLLANEAVHNAFIDFSHAGHRTKGIAVGRYVIMPDHAHIFVAGPPSFRLEQWGRMLKQALGRLVKPRAGSTGASQKRPYSRDGIWQRGFFDHLMRNSESYARKWEYVRMNPMRVGLVKDPEDWPFQGQIVPLEVRNG